ncbi:hypothetical protein BN863_28850 [Formosa agariphila KMM 3901]|uniref:Uncharacterized protein n=1 Tax=Formosa agariphila (strain DSM 15362 / KCTC 12365 / LMG 23005 / KMM 3901 / M-2Alg 35-1) TaxID=1347342 RepID=T2KP07_FORAG|nr:hypothetical protein [Formosa agariphila]CDF80597.1 hypothetical protein BN863_28850 [Formosa agariphila KMM 3901]
MTEIYTTYTVQGLVKGFLWEFKYDLNGRLRSFKIIDGDLTGNQMKWLFNNSNFPASETLMKTIWINNKELKTLMKVTIGEPDLTFDTFWDAYGHKLKKIDTQKFWSKMSKKDKIDAIAYIKTYDNYLARKGVAKTNPHRYLSKRYWEDNHASIH